MIKYQLIKPNIKFFKFPRAKKEIERETQIFFFNVAAEVQKHVRGRAPKATGHLVNSIQVRLFKDYAEVFTRAKYAAAQEYGRRASYAPYKPLINWVRLTKKGKSYLAALRSKPKYANITAVGAAIMLAKSMKKRARKGKFYFDRGFVASLPRIMKERDAMLRRMAEGLMTK